ncbi:MAG: glycosyltransferase [Melioribacteraceae bacterium]|nr:glycosyltransferase [Melioribacteraceae bacterium]
MIVVFRNESAIIRKNVLSLNNINYSDKYLEIIYVNDDSSDDTASIIEENIRRSNWRIINNNNNTEDRAHKKRAIEKAVDEASGEIIFLTDADCIVPPDWIKVMLTCFKPDVSMVAGPVTFIEEETLFQKFQKLEFAGLNLVAAGLTGNGKPSICSSANLAFRKNIFIQLGGYEDYKLSSGDDELLMQRISRETDTSISFCFNKSTLVFTRTNTTLREFIQQRRRWASKGIFYRDKYFVAKLIIIYLFYLSIPLSFILSFFKTLVFLPVLIFLLALKFICEYRVLKQGLTFYYSKRIFNIFIIAQFIQIPYIVILPVMGLFGNFKWKDRTIKR